MTIKVRILIAAVLICGLLIIINMLRKRELELKYVLGWLLCDLVLLIFTAVPGIMVGISNFLGIYSPVNMIFFLGFVFSLIIIFSLTVALSRVTARVRRLAQIVALEKMKQEKDSGETVSAAMREEKKG